MAADTHQAAANDSQRSRTTPPTSLPNPRPQDDLLSLSSIFMTFAVYYMGQKLTWNYAASGVCLAGAVLFTFYFKPAA